jgi:hypothetical protein
MTESALSKNKLSTFWYLYMRIYEKLWNSSILPPNVSIQVPIKNIGFDQMEQDATRICDLLKGIRRDSYWLDQVTEFTTIFKKYCEQAKSLESSLAGEACSAGEEKGEDEAANEEAGKTDKTPGAGDDQPSPEMKPDKPDQENGGAPKKTELNEDTAKSILNRHGDKSKETPMSLKEWKELMSKFTDGDLAVKQWYDLQAQNISILPPHKDSFQSGPLLKGWTANWRSGCDKFEEIRWDKYLESAIDFPLEGVNLKKTQKFNGQGILKEKTIPLFDIYVDSSRSMPDAYKERNGSPLALAALVLAYSAINYGSRARMCNYVTSKNYITTDNHELFGKTGQNKLLDIALAPSRDGKRTTFPFALLMERVKIMTAPGNKAHYHIVVISDMEIYYLLEKILANPGKLIHPNISLEFFIKPGEYKELLLEMIGKIKSQGVPLDFEEHNFIEEWADLTNYAKESAQRRLEFVGGEKKEVPEKE